MYVDRLADLKKRGDPVEARAREAKSRPEAFDLFGKAVIHVEKFLQKYKDGVSNDSNPITVTQYDSSSQLLYVMYLLYCCIN